MADDLYYQKYLKYKAKYFNLKSFAQNKQFGGSNKNEPVEIYLFKADWCGHCRGFKPTWEKLSKELNSKYKFITVDADKDKDKIEKWKIQGFPTIIKKVGENATEYVGPRDEQSVKDFIQKN
jgi:thiol-disulfide isomerase/thioredoxin